MGVASNGNDPVNLYALVIYIPDPLGRFFDDLRREIAPHCIPHAHVSVLPPRPISAPWQLVCEEARARAEQFAPFEIEAGDLAVFPKTDVVYLELARGGDQMRELHAALSRALLAFDEPHQYHPHITLAQEIPHELVDPVCELARRRWSEYTGQRTFRAERAIFVQNTSLNRWVDLAQFDLGAVTVGS